MTRSRVPESFVIARAALAILLSLALLVSTLWAASSAVLGTVVFADRARVGDAGISAGATVFSGDRLSTDHVGTVQVRSEEHTSELQSRLHLVCRLLLEKKKINIIVSREGSRNRRRLKANQTGKTFRVGIHSNISTNSNNLISGVDRCIQLNAMKKTTITSINRQTIKI